MQLGSLESQAIYLDLLLLAVDYDVLVECLSPGHRVRLNLLRKVLNKLFLTAHRFSLLFESCRCVLHGLEFVVEVLIELFVLHDRFLDLLQLLELLVAVGLFKLSIHHFLHFLLHLNLLHELEVSLLQLLGTLWATLQHVNLNVNFVGLLVSCNGRCHVVPNLRLAGKLLVQLAHVDSQALQHDCALVN